LQVDKPDKTKFDAEIKELTDAIENLKKERQAIQDKVELAMDNPEAKAKLQAARAEFNELKNKKNALINDKKALRDELNSMKDSADKIVKEKNSTKANMKFSSMEEIDAAIAKLKRQQETTTMTLNEEKRIIKEMEGLQASKRFISDIKSKDQAMENVKEQRKLVQQRITLKDKEIDEISAKLDAIMESIKGINDQDSKKRDSLNDLFKKRDSYKALIGDKLKQRDALRDENREKNNAWFNYQRALRAQKKIAYEEEKKQREEERAAHLAKLEEEELKKIPYEEEQALCEFLANYLEKTYLTSNDDEPASTDKSEDTPVVKDDPFAGLKPVNKKVDDEFFGKGKSKKKRVREKKQDQASGAFTLSVDTFEQFGLLSLAPPTSVGDVENSVKELREKKEWYAQQPRGSVPTAKEIRKASEKKNGAKSSENGNTAPAAKSGKGKGFNLSNEEFAPLGVGAATSGVNSMWGQKTAAF
jgi:uncharacterized coiled-coil DUF342 family protein